MIKTPTLEQVRHASSVRFFALGLRLIDVCPTGALMVIVGAFVATGTGVGLVTVVTTTLFGIPWITVGSLAITGVRWSFSRSGA